MDFAEPEVWKRRVGRKTADRATALAVQGFAHAAQRWPDVGQAPRVRMRRMGAAPPKGVRGRART